MDRYLFGDDDHPAEDEKEISHLTRLVSTLPSSEALDHRAYLDYHAQRDEAFIRSSVKWLSHVAQAVQPPYDCNELYANLIVPFDEMPAGLVTQWAATLNKGWPESAAVLTLRGLAKLEDENKPEEALDCFGLALAKDSEYWLAAWNCARIYAANKNWQGAFSYYSKALNTGAAQQLPGLQFDAAWCLGQLKRYPAEEKRYRLCLAGC